MSAELHAGPAYDRIAHLYDVDMAQNMRFPDVDFYARLSASKCERVLELGCGNGRVLLELAARGINVVGVDRSQRMLTELLRKAASRALDVRTCAMDVRRLGFGVRFDVVLCPYSLVTYMIDERDAVQMLDEVNRVLAPGGVAVVDAFIRRPVGTSREFTRDYVRPYGKGSLIRSKRITALTARVNRIERRYEVVAADGTIEEGIDTCEDIRVYAPDELTALLHKCGMRTRELWWNYTSTNEIADAQFFTAIAERA
jgi:ubiquinone/menaquinone biosynthesis C-methylase UbiE